VGEVRIGCSGWNYAHWRGELYPPGLAASRWLRRYAELFDTVEVNATFYRLTTRKAAAGWAEQTPADFVFAVKASRFLTHVKRLRDLGPGVDRFYEPLEPLAAAGKLGPVLWQLPESFHRDDERLAETLSQLPAGRHAFEFRHPSWFADGVYALLEQHGAALVVGDTPHRPFQTQERTADWTYVRFHYGSRGRGGNYSEREVESWAERVARFAGQGDVYAYFNNDWGGYAPRNAARLRALVTARVRPRSGSRAR